MTGECGVRSGDHDLACQMAPGLGVVRRRAHCRAHVVDLSREGDVALATQAIGDPQLEQVQRLARDRKAYLAGWPGLDEAIIKAVC